MIIRFIVQHPYVVDAFCLLLPLLLIVIGWRMAQRRRLSGCALTILGAVAMLVYAYGRYVGSRQFEVRHAEYASADLPRAFDGYRIVHFSDAHVGSFSGSRQALLQRAVDSINAQQADLVVFTGDLQNISVDEIEEHRDILSKVEAPDGVFAVLGNHDYAMYLPQDDLAAIDRQLGLTDGIYAQLGWTLLRNSRLRICRDSASIVIAGMENDGEGRFPQLGNIARTLWGLKRTEFIVMLEHDPTAWRRKILPHCHAQLTLSGHTHGGQMSVLGWSPASLIYHEFQGMYYAGSRALHVSRGLGGVLPFRLGCPGEITVITLRSEK